MRTPRGILTVLGSAGLLVAVAVVALVVLRPGLPDPAVADRAGLLRWLVVRDLSREPSETRQVLARRLEEEFCEGADWQAVGEQLDESKRQRLWSNVLVLLEPWFMDKLDRYFTLAGVERPAFLDRIIAVVSAWRGLDALAPTPTEGAETGKKRGGLVAALLKQVDQWKADAQPRQQERISEFVAAIQTRWFLRELGLLPLPQ